MQGTSDFDHLNLEDFNEFLRRYATIFSKIRHAKAYTYHKFKKSMINKNDTVVLKGGKNSNIVIMDKDYVNKSE